MTSIEAARNLLPFWVVWGPLLLTLPGILVLSLVCNGLGTALALGPFLRQRPTFWVERARLAYPGAVVAGRSTLVLPILFATLFLLGGAPLCPVPTPILILLAALASYLGAGLAARWAERRIHDRRLSFHQRLRAELAGWVLAGGWLLVLATTTAFMPPRLDRLAWALLAFGALGVAFFALGGGLLLGQAVGLVRPVDARVEAIIARAAARVGIPPPRASEIPFPIVNAFALPFLGRLAFTARIVELFTDEELEVIIAHELAHLSEPWLARLGRVLPLFLLVPLTAAVPLVAHIGMLGLLAIEVVLFVLILLVGWLSRSMERRADALAHSQEAEAGVYARALLRLYEANLAPVVAPGKGGSHPHLYDRLLAAGVTPEFARPAAPSRWRVGLGTLVAFGLPGIFVLAAFVLGSVQRSDERVQLGILAIRGGGAFPLGDLALLRARQGQVEAAALLYLAAAELDQESPWYPANAAIVLANEGRCPEAENAAQEAQRRHDANPGRGSYIVLDAWRAVELCHARRLIP